MRPLRERTLTHWLIAIGVFVISLLLITVVYVLLQPQVFTPVTQPTTPEVPGGTLPPEQTGPPTFPQSPVEQIPLDQVQGLDTQPGIDQIALGDITVVSTIGAQSANFSTLGPAGNDLNFYDPDQKRFYRIGTDGVITKISNQVFAEVESVAWAPNASDAVLEFPDGSNIVYNFDLDTQVTLPAHWQDFDFSPDSNNLAFKSLALDADQRFLAVSSKEGSAARRIEPLGENERIVDVDWSPNNQVIATYTQPTSLDSSELFFIGLNGENFPLSKLQGLNFEGSWSPNGTTLLYSVAHPSNNLNPQLWLVDGAGNDVGQNRQSIGLNTWSYKCSYANASTVYCGVPTTLPRGAGLIPSVADNIPDELFKIDLTSGSTTRIAIPATELNVQSMQVSADGKELFIQDRFTNQLKKVQLAE